MVVAAGVGSHLVGLGRRASELAWAASLLMGTVWAVRRPDSSAALWLIGGHAVHHLASAPTASPVTGQMPQIDPMAALLALSAALVALHLSAATSGSLAPRQRVPRTMLRRWGGRALLAWSVAPVVACLGWGLALVPRGGGVAGDVAAGGALLVVAALAWWLASSRGRSRRGRWS